MAVEGGAEEDKKASQKTYLDHNHSHFILVDNQGDSSAGSEQAFLAAFEKSMAAAQHAANWSDDEALKRFKSTAQEVHAYTHAHARAHTRAHIHTQRKERCIVFKRTDGLRQHACCQGVVHPGSRDSQCYCVGSSLGMNDHLPTHASISFRRQRPRPAATTTCPSRLSACRAAPTLSARSCRRLREIFPAWSFAGAEELPT